MRLQHYLKYVANRLVYLSIMVAWDEANGGREVIREGFHKVERHYTELSSWKSVESENQSLDARTQ